MQPEGRNFKLVWNYEFKGTVFNVSKWSCRTNFGGRWQIGSQRPKTARWR